MNTFEAPPRTARVPDLPPPRTTGQRLLTPDLPAEGAPTGIPRPLADGPRLPSAPPPARPNVMTLPPATLLSPGHPSGNGPRPAATLAPNLLFEAPSDSVLKVRERRRKQRFRRMVSLLVLLTTAAGGVLAWTRLRPQEDATWPATWDPRVLPMVDFVEATRQKAFDHPVTIEFLPPDEYRARLHAEALDVTDEERADAAYAEELNDLFGLTATYRLLEHHATIESLSSLGYYSPETDSIVVRGASLTPGVRATVVHELTHALQAQHSDIGARFGDRATRSMAEADAMAVEGSYKDTMTPEDLWQASEESQLSEEDRQALAAVPWPLVELEYAPYRLGALAIDHRPSADDALADPPTERQMIAPWAGPDPDLRDLTASAPAGTTVVEENQQLSVLETLVAFDAWLPWSVARPAFDTWLGGVFTTYRLTEDGPLCAAVRVRLSVPGEGFAAVATWWSAAMGAPATPTVQGNDVEFNLCARGEGAPEPPPAVVPTTIAVELEVSMIPADQMPAPGQMTIAQIGQPTITQYLCVGRTVVDDPALGPLITEAFPTAQQQATIDRGIDAAVRDCLG